MACMGMQLNNSGISGQRRSLPFADNHQKAAVRPRFSGEGRLPFSVLLHQNELLNRFVIDTLGYSSWSVIIARNDYERMENGLDWAGWLLAGLALPYVIERGVNRWAQNRLHKKHKHLGVLKKVKNRNTLLSMPYQWLDATSSKLKTMTGKESLQYGVKNLAKLTPKVLQAALMGKLLMMWIDLLLLAGKNQGYAWVKNWMTEKLSGKKGFSGEFNYANQAYLDKQTQAYQTSKQRRKAWSFGIGFGGALLFPLLMLGVLKSKKATGVMGALKKKVKAFNYSDAIFMSKWVLLVSNLTNWAPATILSSRDKHERREKITKMIAFDTLFFLGDDFIAGIAAKVLQGKKKLDTNIVRTGKWLKLPRAVPLDEVFRAVGKDKANKAYKLARKSFWIGILGTAAALGVTMPLLNFWYTKKKVMAEQAAFNISELPLYRVISARPQGAS